MIRVLIVDDSPTIRTVFTRILSAEADIEVVGAAEDPYQARDMIVALRPDVLTLDIEMPRMDGLTFLRKLTTHYPLPTVVVSSLTKANSARAIEAFDSGAVEVLCKPAGPDSVPVLASQLTRAVRNAAGARVTQRPLSPTPQRPASNAAQAWSPERLILIGASTGGPSAVESILCALPPTPPPILVAQHMPAGFTAAFAERLKRLTGLDVQEAQDGAAIRPGVALIAPGGAHLIVKKHSGALVAEVRHGPRVNAFAPSIDVLFKSAARELGRSCAAVLLTGMGRDGASGLLELRQTEALTFAQDEASSVVFGMPKAALDLRAVDACTPLQRIPDELYRRMRTETRAVGT